MSHERRLAFGSRDFVRVASPPACSTRRGDRVSNSPSEIKTRQNALEGSRRPTAEDETGGDPRRGDQAGGGGQGVALPGDVERGAVGNARPHDRQAERHVHGAVEADRLEGDVPLVVVHRDHGVELTADRAMEQSVGGDRPDRRRSRRLAPLDRRGNDPHLLVAEQAPLAGMRVQPRHPHARTTTGRQRPQAPRRPGRWRRRPSRSSVDRTPSQGDVQRGMNDAQAGRANDTRSPVHGWFAARQVEHHRVPGRATAGREDLGVTGVVDARGVAATPCSAARSRSRRSDRPGPGRWR